MFAFSFPYSFTLYAIVFILFYYILAYICLLHSHRDHHLIQPPSKVNTIGWINLIFLIVPIALPQRSKLGPQHRLSKYVGFNSPFIIRYLEPIIGDVFTVYFVDCHFDKNVFPSLKGDKSKE